MDFRTQEELQHAMKVFDFIMDREGKVTLAAVKPPTGTWKSPLAAVQDALKSERANTKQINDLVELSFATKDHATRVFLQWFVDEQVEEEASASKLVEKVKLVKDSKGALFILDQELASRQLTE